MVNSPQFPFWWITPDPPRVTPGPVARALADECRDVWARFRSRQLGLDAALAKMVTITELAERMGVQDEYNAARDSDSNQSKEV